MKNVYSLKHTVMEMKIKTIVTGRKYLKIIYLRKNLDTRIYKEFSKLSITETHKQMKKQKRQRFGNFTKEDILLTEK